MNHRRSIAGSAFLVVALAAFAWQQGGWTTPPAMTHDAAGRDNCMMCHKAGAMEPVSDVPADHAERPNDTCMMCHAPDARVQTVTPSVTPHPIEGRDNCMMCHTAGAMEPVPDAPPDHEGRDNQYCALCHIPV